MCTDVSNMSYGVHNHNVMPHHLQTFGEYLLPNITQKKMNKNV